MASYHVVKYKGTGQVGYVKENQVTEKLHDSWLVKTSKNENGKVFAVEVLRADIPSLKDASRIAKQLSEGGDSTAIECSEEASVSMISFKGTCFSVVCATCEMWVLQ